MKNLLKTIIKPFIPSKLRIIYRQKKNKHNIELSIYNDYKYDFLRYKKLSASLELKSQEMIKAYLTKEYHAIEKGLSLHNPKPFFGLSRIEKLIHILDKYILKYGRDKISDITISVLREYLNFNKAYNKNDNDIINLIKKTIAVYDYEISQLSGGTKSISKESIEKNLNFDFNLFFKSRYSIRDFSPDPVDTETILEAIDLAKYTPSVCNRQAWKSYVIEDSNKDLKKKLLELQNGNKGFGENISVLIVVTGKLSSFFSSERNQVFIDGGMFAMSLILALHAKGLGTCCLNTSYTASKNTEFNKVIDIDEDCVPIMFIAVGHLKPDFKVALSQRKPLDELVSVR